MTFSRSRTLVLAAFVSSRILASAVAPAGALADEPPRRGTELAPALKPDDPGLAPQPGGPEESAKEPSWRLCEVTASLLATAPGRSIVADETTGFVYLGEDLDLLTDVTVPLPQGTALVHARMRLRAAAATSKGVTYFIASSGALRSTIGFQHPMTGQDQFRNEMLEVTDTGTRLHEVFALPDLSLRVVAVLKVRPVAGREETSVLESLRDPVAGTIRRFDIEAHLKEADRMEPLERATLSTMDGRTARLSLTRFGIEGTGGLPKGMPGVPTVRTIQVPGAPATSAEDMGAVRQVPADRRFQDRVDALQRSIRMDPTVDLGQKLPGQRDLPGTPRKISAAKRKKIQELQKRQAIRDWAIEQSKKLPSSEAVPEGYDSEELSLEVTPLRVTQTSLQVEIRLRGRIKLPKEEAHTAIDATLVEQLRFGETLELGIAELVREGEPLYDYVLRITPEP